MSREDTIREVSKVFIDESRDYLRKMNAELVRLEAAPELASGDGVAHLFRMAHSIKGAALSLGFDQVGRLAGELETVLGEMRGGRLKLSPPIADAFLAAFDTLGALLDQKPGVQLDPVVAMLAATRSTPTATGPARPLTTPAPDVAPERPAGATEKTLRIDVEQLEGLLMLAREIASIRARTEGRLAQARELLERVEAGRAQVEQFAGAGLSMPAAAVSELLQTARAANEAARALSSEIGRDAFGLRLSADSAADAARQARTVPVNNVAPLLQRAVRDAARVSGKSVAFELHGGELKVDRRLLEGITDSLVHLLRNAVDHGLEPPEARHKAGKPPEGRVEVLARQQGGLVELVVSDDGRGLDEEAVRAQALRAGLVRADRAASLSRAELASLAFTAGFSTGQTVTELSGRGVGLDVVQSQVRALRGEIAVDSEPGRGMRFTLRLPIDVSSLRLLVLRAARNVFAVPVHSAERLVSFAPGDRVIVEGAPSLKTPTGVMAYFDLDPQGSKARVALVLRTPDGPAALAVDEVVAEEELVVKPLPPPLDRIPAVTGAARRRDQSLVVIFDAAGLVRTLREGGTLVNAGNQRAPGRAVRPRRVLVVDDSPTSRLLQSSLLERAGFEVVIANDGAEALERLGDDPQRFLAILTDVEMPVLDGFGLCEAVRKRPDAAQLPVIMLTSLDDAQQRERGTRVGATAYLTKQTYEPAALLDLLERL